MRTPKQRLVISVLSLVVFAAAIYLPLYLKYRSLQETNGSNTTPPVAQDGEATAISNLDGSEAPKSLANRHPLAVMVENHPDARPQFGLGAASVVYEALTEGGITRFLAVYGPKNAAKIGPVRSARTYYIDWLKEYDAFFAHAGGAQNALTKIVQDDIKDLPHNQSAYWRETSKLALEHTLFTGTDKLYQYAQNQGYDVSSSTFRPWVFKKDLAPAVRSASGQNATINFSSSEYLIAWRYDNTSNGYIRSQAGTEHKDALTGTPISARNVVILTLPRSSIESAGKAVYAMTTTGSGKAIVLQDGLKIEGTWQKAKTSDRTVIYDSMSKEVSFNAGSTWIEIINPDAVTVTIQ